MRQLRHRIVSQVIGDELLFEISEAGDLCLLAVDVAFVLEVNFDRLPISLCKFDLWRLHFPDQVIGDFGAPKKIFQEHSLFDM